ncbi:DUF1479-domain-containing protein [Coniophora puteana RWD-64-598 SS2]|uniref:DUF1479-domain-containing protein n=1 Tax=Coniophora puteana (strain RWD-64-598) TaxID=741705 RepID=A0A5M3MM94_CONPW|nr:DUF1479-domain-containing protein [Coniophora puteana RWD-64-598 SS2]EIW80166.1 DUF1479-domain-containing protein [Coniophora puteana RWD-64-598 SS2]
MPPTATSALAPPSDATRRTSKPDKPFDDRRVVGPSAKLAPLSDHLLPLKRTILAELGTSPEQLEQSWRGVLAALEVHTAKIAQQGGDAIPHVHYKDIEKGISEEQKVIIRDAGCVVVQGAVSEEEAVGWETSLKDLVKAHPGIQGYPSHDPQAYELYNTQAQTRARTHPAVLNTQKALLKFWGSSLPRASADGEDLVDYDTPVSYYDRLRLRKPGDRSFVLGPHIDGGCVERWEDPVYRKVWGKILSGGDSWKEYDPYDARWRLGAKQDLYGVPNQCTAHRSWQGWTSISHNAAGEGTLQLLPMLRLATAYVILRPFFRPRDPSSGSLHPDDWELDLDSAMFPGSRIGASGQELSVESHPHLRLEKTMVSIPRTRPGDQVYWHCDGVHAVEGYHGGKNLSSVMYIPAAPLCMKNARYLRDQRVNFVHGHVAPDFPASAGESTFPERGTTRDIKTDEGHRALGFMPFEVHAPELVPLVDAANAALFGQ